MSNKERESPHMEEEEWREESVLLFSVPVSQERSACDA